MPVEWQCVPGWHRFLFTYFLSFPCRLLAMRSAGLFFVDVSLAHLFFPTPGEKVGVVYISESSWPKWSVSVSFIQKVGFLSLELGGQRNNSLIFFEKKKVSCYPWEEIYVLFVKLHVLRLNTMLNCIWSFFQGSDWRLFSSPLSMCLLTGRFLWGFEPPSLLVLPEKMLSACLL